MDTQTSAHAEQAQQQQMNIGVLITNLGTPDAPTSGAVRRYLNQFLSDKRVVELPSWIWQPILKGIILPLRGRQSAKLYQSIWGDDAPLREITAQQAQALQANFSEKYPTVQVEYAMRYGKPSIEEALKKFQSAGISKLLVLPLYPQYSATTTGSTFDAVTQCLSKQRYVPALQFISHYADNPSYIDALVDSVNAHWKTQPKAQKLIFSFHGLPKVNLEKGDPYYCFCHKTARLVAEKLQLSKDEWELVFQSRFGKQAWLQPYCVDRLTALPEEGVTSVDVICPGFSADCLETLEEITITNKNIFLEQGGKQFNYIPCLNDSPSHIHMLYDLIVRHLQSWLPL